MALRHFIFSVSVSMLCNFSFGQKGISYQGVILYPTVEIPGIDSNVTPYSEKDVCIRFGVYDDSNLLEYSETHNTRTDYYGQINLVIGRGDNPSLVGRLEDLRWDGTEKFLKVELDYSGACTDWTDVSYDELNYVPFAFYALESEQSTFVGQGNAPIVVTGSGNLTDPLIVSFDGSLNNLSDVDLSIPPISGQILRYDGTSWTAGNSTLSQVVSKFSATSGQTRFNTLNPITDINNISVFRNGISVDFVSLGVNVIELVGISCFAGDKIKIIQIL